MQFVMFDDNDNVVVWLKGNNKNKFESTVVLDETAVSLHYFLISVSVWKLRSCNNLMAGWKN